MRKTEMYRENAHSTGKIHWHEICKIELAFFKSMVLNYWRTRFGFFSSLPADLNKFMFNFKPKNGGKSND
jgi:hypothetical protein